MCACHLAEVFCRSLRAVWVWLLGVACTESRSVKTPPCFTDLDSANVASAAPAWCHIKSLTPSLTCLLVRGFMQRTTQVDKSA